MYVCDQPTHGVKFITNDPRRLYKPLRSVDANNSNEEKKEPQNRKSIEYNSRNVYMEYSLDDNKTIQSSISTSVLPSKHHKIKQSVSKEKPSTTSRIISNLGDSAFNIPMEQYNSYALKLPKPAQNSSNQYRKRHKHIQGLVTYRSNRGQIS